MVFSMYGSYSYSNSHQLLSLDDSARAPPLLGALEDWYLACIGRIRIRIRISCSPSTILHEHRHYQGRSMVFNMYGSYSYSNSHQLLSLDDSARAPPLPGTLDGV